MAIPRRTIPVSLTEATPTPLTVDALKQQLTDIGLTCPDSEEGKLAAYIAEVERTIPSGSVQTYAILKPAGEGDVALAGFETDLAQAAVGNWEPDSTGFGYATVLEYIQYAAHFDWLLDNLPSFTGTKVAPPPYKGRYDTIDGVKKMFSTVATDASSTLVKGVDRTRWSRCSATPSHPSTTPTPRTTPRDRTAGSSSWWTTTTPPPRRPMASGC